MEGAIATCSCAAFTQSALACKHMFLAQRITTFNIHFENATLPARSYQPGFQAIPDDYLNEKEQLLGKLRDFISRIHSDPLLVSMDREQLKEISRENLTRLVSTAQGFFHMQQDTLSNRPDNAKQHK
jgi:hypothetical protein